MAEEREHDRLPWETTGGPEVGVDVPITSEPRREVEPGVPASADGDEKVSQREGVLEEREVRAADPDLSEQTNQRLTEELREVIGKDRVRVPADRPRASEGDKPTQQSVGAYMSMHRLQLVRLTAIVLTFAGIISLVTGIWWLLPLAAGLHALGTMTVTLSIIRMTTISEHPAPEVAAAMSEDGVSSADERFSEMVAEFREDPGRGTEEVLSRGFNERTASASEAPAAASAEQSSAMTPTGDPSEPAGEDALPALLPWGIALGLLVLSVVLPAVMGGGWLWLLTGVMVPLLIAWMITQRLLRTRQPRLSWSSLAAIVICTALAVAGFCAVVAVAFVH